MGKLPPPAAWAEAQPLCSTVPPQRAEVSRMRLCLQEAGSLCRRAAWTSDSRRLQVWSQSPKTRELLSQTWPWRVLAPGLTQRRRAWKLVG